MQNYPTLKTAISELILEPLSQSHIPFLVSLLSSTEIQKTLFRTPTKITPEKEYKAIEKMYVNDKKPKEITYVLTLTKFLTKIPIGYVKIKIIDWIAKSCYLSVAILPDPLYRRKGYAKACYDRFFEYLFSLGFMKIYGRTYESNTETIKLNEKTGFRFIGRQTKFILYPNKTSHDALFFERLNPDLESYRNVFESELSVATEIISKLTKDPNDKDLLTQLEECSKETILQPIQKYLHEIISELKTSRVTEEIDLESPFHRFRATAAKTYELEILSYPITQKQRISAKQAEKEFTSFLDNGRLGSYTTENSLKYGGYTLENWEYLRLLFLGKNHDNSFIQLIASIRKQDLYSKHHRRI
ncbi:GNAT family N-acetyltransferase [bacterium]|nr:GNAT family N-acetyltransferase [bacterium]